MKQKPSKAARDRAIGVIGPGAVAKLEQAGFVIVDKATLERLQLALAQLERKAP